MSVCIFSQEAWSYRLSFWFIHQPLVIWEIFSTSQADWVSLSCGPLSKHSVLPDFGNKTKNKTQALFQWKNSFIQTLEQVIKRQFPKSSIHTTLSSWFLEIALNSLLGPGGQFLNLEPAWALEVGLGPVPFGFWPTPAPRVSLWWVGSCARHAPAPEEPPPRKLIRCPILGSRGPYKPPLQQVFTVVLTLLCLRT